MSFPIISQRLPALACLAAPFLGSAFALAQTGTLLAQLKEQHLLCGTMSFAFEADGKIELLDMLDDDIDFKIDQTTAVSDANRIEMKVPGVGAPFVITRNGDKLVHNEAICEKKK